jgi:hypothetical protein
LNPAQRRRIVVALAIFVAFDLLIVLVVAVALALGSD